jgi:ABC-type transport system involved in multi-copper enzyme maturation permease subunit
MPIYAPTLPPAPDLHQGQPPAMVLMRFDFTRLWRQKIGRFFGFAFLMLLLWKVARIYIDHLLQTNQAFKPMQDFAKSILTQGADFQADLLNPANYLLWFLVALVGGGLVARDTLYRVRPLMYAHPVAPKDYLLAKLGFASLLPFVILLPFALLPWMMSLLLAGFHGPVWVTAPLRLLPAMAISSVLMGSLAVGASSMAATPRAGIGWVLGLVLGASTLASMIHGLTGLKAVDALNPVMLAETWPQLFVGVQHPMVAWLPAILGTAFHIALWTFVAAKRTQPSEAVI